MMQNNIRTLSAQLENGEISAAAVAAECLAVANNSEGVFTEINGDLIAEAEAVDQARARREQASVLAGIPLTLKDLYGVKGQPTYAGSKSLVGIAGPESQDCDVVAPLRQAGMLFAGRTNMSEFAFSGMGRNPHFPPLTSVWDRQTGRLPGGSSSGSAVSVAIGAVAGTLGSDTAGSCRIPAAFNGIVGVKPTYGRLSLEGVYPLSPSSDAPGPMAVDVDSCFLLDQMMSGAFDRSAALPQIEPVDASRIRIMVPEGVVMSGLDDEIASAFEKALNSLDAAGCSIKRAPMSVVDDCAEMFMNRPVVPYEAWQHHKSMIEQRGELYDPFVSQRASAASHLTAADQQARYDEKANLIKRFNSDFVAERIDVLVYPAVRCIPPAVSEIADPDNMPSVNLRCLRNTATANYFDGCSITVPCHHQGEAPAGFMISAMGGEDQKLYQLAATIEQVINENR